MIKVPKDKLNRVFTDLTTPKVRFLAFVVFIVMVFFTGGSSRDDVQSLVILRPIAILFGAYALTCRRSDQWRGRLFPLAIAFALLVLMILQLTPLPPFVWTEIPGRKIFAEIADLAGISQPWRPITLSPSRTLNSLFSLAVPITAMMLYLNLDQHRAKQVISIIIVLAAISALWAILQLAGSSRGPLYLYSVTNSGDAVGLFANRNHQAVLLAAAIVMLGWYAVSSPPAERFSALKLYSSIAMIFVLVPLIFITGSRAGLVLMVPALIAAMTLFYFGPYMVENPSIVKKGKKKKYFGLSLRKIIVAISMGVVMLMGVLSIYFSRSLAFDRLFGDGEISELRAQVLPTLVQMLIDYAPWGTGFGSFEHVYKIHEPQELLKPTYLNQAHNDWLQFPIEGGVAAILIGIVSMAWAASQLVKLAQKWNMSRYTKHIALMAIVVMLIFLGGSVGDYPLRSPSLITTFALMACIFSDAVRAVQRREKNA